jgi:hypothetical protein
MIRHGEKPPKLPNGEDADGLSAQGVTRAQGLRQVFGVTSRYNIGYILAEHPKSGQPCPFLVFFRSIASNLSKQTEVEPAPTKQSHLWPVTLA